MSYYITLYGKSIETIGITVTIIIMVYIVTYFIIKALREVDVVSYKYIGKIDKSTLETELNKIYNDKNTEENKSIISEIAKNILDDYKDNIKIVSKLEEIVYTNIIFSLIIAFPVLYQAESFSKMLLAMFVLFLEIRQLYKLTMNTVEKFNKYLMYQRDTDMSILKINVAKKIKEENERIKQEIYEKEIKSIGSTNKSIIDLEITKLNTEASVNNLVDNKFKELKINVDDIELGKKYNILGLATVHVTILSVLEKDLIDELDNLLKTE